jgi:hypothetical protein
MDHNHYNLPTSIEVMAIIPGSGEEERQEYHKVALHLCEPQEDDPTWSNFLQISHLNPLYTPLHHVLLSFLEVTQNGILEFLSIGI